MPKIKTNRLARKKYKVTKSGELKRAQAFKSHKTAGRGPKRRRKLSKMVPVSKVDQKAVARQLPYHQKGY